MTVDVSPAALSIAFVIVTAIVGAAVKVALSADKVTKAAEELKSHTNTLTTLQVSQGQQDVRIDTHDGEIDTLRKSHHDLANKVAGIDGRCTAAHPIKGGK